MTTQVPDWEPVVPRKAGHHNYFTRKAVPPPFADNGKEEDLEQAPAAALFPKTPVVLYKSSLKDRFDRVLPPRRKYLGRSRRTCLLVSLAIFICLLILIIGLGVGLSKKSSIQNLPLPSAGGIHTGDLTYYGVGLGACGITGTDSQMICAVSHYVYDAEANGSNPNSNPLCGKRIRIQRFDERVNGNRSIDVTVIDRCVGCKPTDLDLSPTAFGKLADPNLGRVTGSWAWLD